MLNKATDGNVVEGNRWVIDLSFTEAKVQTTLYSLWRKWGLQLTQKNTTAVPKRTRHYGGAE